MTHRRMVALGSSFAAGPVLASAFGQKHGIASAEAWVNGVQPLSRFSSSFHPNVAGLLAGSSTNGPDEAIASDRLPPNPSSTEGQVAIDCAQGRS